MNALRRQVEIVAAKSFETHLVAQVVGDFTMLDWVIPPERPASEGGGSDQEPSRTIKMFSPWPR